MLITFKIILSRPIWEIYTIISPSEEYVIILEEGLEAFNFWADEILPGIALLFNIVNAPGLFRFLWTT